MAQLRSLLLPTIFCLGGLMGNYFDRYTQSKNIVAEKASLVTTTDNKCSLGDIPSSAKEIMKFGFPSCENLKFREDYVLSYNRVHRTANWVIEHLTADKVFQRDFKRKSSMFKEDTSVPVLFRSTKKDYRNSGFDRGHLAPAGDHGYSLKALKDTFYLSNMSPQVGVGFNRDIWKRLEEYTRNQTRVYTDIYVITGPLYLPKESAEKDGKRYVKYQVIGKNDVSVPTHFFKIIVGDNRKKKSNAQLQLQVFQMPNEKISKGTPLDEYKTSLKSVEKASGLLFLDKASSLAIATDRSAI
ncbi:uncharacterized protein TRIADDRAFT_55918 [Trichoplax adhaerens]|uniref:Endonuclease n=1 Tax=Trichoplax adhaerens TaxID=10228 RepID=B3RW82_TRIAD|nr:hypothetical protein TRIADDRAFT_55918 [Trichoplax adhaerens]EDV25624.1 hypothetical protein TRIADDRAFT_55918 [Trichoplax adhaerens]|eukprot:XP_002111657.1 hypothetical protein TRIADDRAFT_55918 [Trichoplax adhaerens]